MKNFSVIAGATGVIGAEFVNQLAKKNKNLILLSRSEKKISSIAKKYKDYENIQFFTYDSFYEKIEKKNIENLYICTGEHLSGSFFDLDIEDYLQNIQANLFEPIKIIKALYKYLLPNSNIIVLNSLASKRPTPDEGSYGIAKSALTKYVESISYDLRVKKINILNVIFGATKSSITKNRKNYRDLIQPSELVEVILANLSCKTSLFVKNLDVERRLP